MAVTSNVRLAAIQRTGAKCQQCGFSGTYENGYWIDLEVDHILPESGGGGHEPENLRVLCYVCHDVRHGRIPRTQPSRRRRGIRYPVIKTLVLSKQDAELLVRLAEVYGYGQSSVVRGAIREAAKREGVE